MGISLACSGHDLLFIAIKWLRLDLPSFTQIRVVPVEAREHAFLVVDPSVKAWLC